MNALILGGSRGIGRATAGLLASRGWRVTAYGRREYDVLYTSNVHLYTLERDAHELGGYDAFIYSAGDVLVRGMPAFKYAHEFYRLVANSYGLLNEGCVIVAMSSVAADRPAKVNPDYAAAKAALESYARTLADSDVAKKRRWRVEVIRFDIVMTDMLTQLPREHWEGREVMPVEVAAHRIATLIEK